MAGTYDPEEREKIRIEMAEGFHWLHARPDDPPPDDPEAVVATYGSVFHAIPGPIHDLHFPIASEALAIGESHDEDPETARDRRKSKCTFPFAGRSGAPSPAGIALGTLIEMARMELDRSLFSIWREIRGLNLYEHQLRGVRVAMRHRHPATRGGLEQLRVEGSGDPEFDDRRADPDSDSLRVRTASAEAVSPAWVAARAAVAEQHAPITYLSTAVVSPAGGYLYSVHPLSTLNQWPLAEWVFHGTLSEAGVRFFNWEMLRQRDPDRGGTLVIPRQAFPFLVHEVRRMIYWSAKTGKDGVQGAGSMLTRGLGVKRLRKATAYLREWRRLLRELRKLLRELRLVIFGVAGLITLLVTFYLTTR